MIKTYLSPGEAWGFYLKNKTALQNASAVVAETASGDTQICLTDIGGPTLQVFMDGDPDPVTSEPILDPDDMEITIEWFFQKYLDSFPTATADDPPSYAPVGADDHIGPAAHTPDPARTPANTHPPVGVDDHIDPSRSAAAHTPDPAQTPANPPPVDNDDDFDLFWNACHSSFLITPNLEKPVLDVIAIRHDDLIQAARDFLSVILDRDEDLLDEDCFSDLPEMILQNVLQDTYDITGLAPWYPTVDGKTLIPYPKF